MISSIITKITISPLYKSKPATQYSQQAPRRSPITDDAVITAKSHNPGLEKGIVGNPSSGKVDIIQNPKVECRRETRRVL